MVLKQRRCIDMFEATLTFELWAATVLLSWRMIGIKHISLKFFSRSSTSWWSLNVRPITSDAKISSRVGITPNKNSLQLARERENSITECALTVFDSWSNALAHYSSCAGYTSGTRRWFMELLWNSNDVRSRIIVHAPGTLAATGGDSWSCYETQKKQIFLNRYF